MCDSSVVRIIFNHTREQVLLFLFMEQNEMPLVGEVELVA